MNFNHYNDNDKCREGWLTCLPAGGKLKLPQIQLQLITINQKSDHADDDDDDHT